MIILQINVFLACRGWESRYGQLISGEHGDQWCHVSRCFICTEYKDTDDIRSIWHNGHDLLIIILCLPSPSVTLVRPLDGSVDVGWQFHYDLNHRIWMAGHSLLTRDQLKSAERCACIKWVRTAWVNCYKVEIYIIVI